MRCNRNRHELSAVCFSHGYLAHRFRLRIPAQSNYNQKTVPMRRAVTVRLQVACLRDGGQLIFGQTIDIAAIETRAWAGRHDAFRDAVGFARSDNVERAFVIDFEVPVDT